MRFRPLTIGVALTLMLPAATQVLAAIPGGGAGEPLQAAVLLGLTHFPFAYQGVAPIAISPDGTQVAYVSEAPQGAATFATGQDALKFSHKNLRVQPFGGGTPIFIGSRDADSSAPVWSPDGSELAFYSGSGKNGTLQIWAVTTQTIRTVPDVRISLPTWAPQWLPDSQRILVPRVRAPDGASPTASPAPSNAAAVTIYSSDVRANGRNDESVHRVVSDTARAIDLSIVDLRTSQTVTVTGDVVPKFFRLSDDGMTLAYTVDVGVVSGDVNSREVYDVFVADIGSGTVKKVAHDILTSAAGYVAWSHDGTKLAFVGGTLPGDASLPVGNYGAVYPGRIYVIDLQHPVAPRSVSSQIFSRTTRELMWSQDDREICTKMLEPPGTLTGIGCASVATSATKPILRLPGAEVLGRSGLIEAGRHLYVILRSDDGDTLVYEIDSADSKSRPVTRFLQAVDFVSFSRDGERAAYEGEDPSHPPDVWTTGEAFAKRSHLSGLNPQFNSESLSDKTLSMSWHSKTGVRLDGTILLPVNYQHGKRYPMIVNIYAGEKRGSQLRGRFGLSDFGPSVYFNLQLFATRGYAVFVPNSALRVGHPMEDIAGSVLPGLDEAISLGIADPHHLGVYGQSYGGYSTFSLIVQSSRFKAAVATSGIVDLVSFYGTLWPRGIDWTGFTETEQGRIGGTPWQYRRRYIENSPFYFLDRVKTPVLLEYGADDFAANFNMPEAFIGLRRLGKEATLLQYAGEGHTLVRDVNQIDFTNRMLAWFAKYL
jgi:dipeptidyl aminopeptidase/acylaminoacyl peptidase